MRCFRDPTTHPEVLAAEGCAQADGDALPNEREAAQLHVSGVAVAHQASAGAIAGVNRRDCRGKCTHEQRCSQGFQVGGNAEHMGTPKRTRPHSEENMCMEPPWPRQMPVFLPNSSAMMPRAGCSTGWTIVTALRSTAAQHVLWP
jgi:hypothetical protein